jgi:hypothetical protein
MSVHHTHELRTARRTANGALGPRATAGVLTAVAAAGALAATCAGLLLDDPYPGAASAAAMFQGYDIVSLLVAVALAAVIRPARRGSAPAVLAQASLLAYLVYTYAYYLFGAGFNDLFLLHVAVFTASLFGLAATVREIDLHRVDSASVTTARSRIAAALLAGLALALGAMWVYFAIHNAVTGDVPAGSRLVETDTIVHLGIALDLALLVPWYAIAATLLWRHRPAGYPAAVVALVAGLLHQVSYIVALPVQVAAEIPGANAVDPGEPVIVLLYGVALALLLTGWRPYGHEGMP